MRRMVWMVPLVLLTPGAWSATGARAGREEEGNIWIGSNELNDPSSHPSGTATY